MPTRMTEDSHARGLLGRGCRHRAPRVLCRERDSSFPCRNLIFCVAIETFQWGIEVCHDRVFFVVTEVVVGVSRQESGTVGLSPIAIGISLSLQSWLFGVATWALRSR